MGRVDMSSLRSMLLGLLFAGTAALLAAPQPVAAATVHAALDLRQNVAPSPDFWPTCQASPASSACQSQVVQAIDAARAAEGVGPLYLPRNFADLTPQEQLFAVLNLERVDRGLPPIQALYQGLSADAEPAAVEERDPVGSGGSAWASNWSYGYGPLTSDFFWMYGDGYDGMHTGNVDCTSPTAAGCWGHRRNILLDVPGAGPYFSIGIGFAHTGPYQVFTTLTYQSTSPLLGDVPVYTWVQELAAGADVPAGDSSLPVEAPSPDGQILWMRTLPQPARHIG